MTSVSTRRFGELYTDQLLARQVLLVRAARPSGDRSGGVKRPKPKVGDGTYHGAYMSILTVEGGGRGLLDGKG
jgi:hypothetical protein